MLPHTKRDLYRWRDGIVAACWGCRTDIACTLWAKAVDIRRGLALAPSPIFLPSSRITYIPISALAGRMTTRCMRYGRPLAIQRCANAGKRAITTARNGTRIRRTRTAHRPLCCRTSRCQRSAWRKVYGGRGRWRDVGGRATCRAASSEPARGRICALLMCFVLLLRRSPRGRVLYAFSISLRTYPATRAASLYRLNLPVLPACALRFRASAAHIASYLRCAAALHFFARTKREPYATAALKRLNACNRRRRHRTHAFSPRAHLSPAATPTSRPALSTWRAACVPGETACCHRRNRFRTDRVAIWARSGRAARDALQIPNR